ncbi:formate dehydrogenase accessory sulfurtransferase FdhD [Anaerosinus massiliensis]|uniref:formate dehydrogenase accessory sulfurtransferase FdhD n=1 Tax=Massilibacillus massiliensis TaxID=1806837 RepID=UPI000A544B2D|nr:formate dehydrogenase accessory sulfurtransferase FdhD [Massilibacillus massiliensis]
MEKEKIEAIETYDTIEFRNAEFHKSSQWISEEMPLTIYLNGKETTTMLCSPVDQKYLVIGFLISEGMVQNLEAIKEININENDGLAYIEADIIEKATTTNYLRRCLTTCCGRGRAGFYFANDHQTTKIIDSNAHFHAADILKSTATLLHEASATHSKTNGVHSGAIVEKGNLILYSEDIGRHNIFDKLYGKCLEQKMSMDDKMIVFSGRISSEILIKVSKMGIPCVLAKSVPTTLALGMAKDLGITIVGSIRRDSFLIYTHPERIVT